VDIVGGAEEAVLSEEVSDGADVALGEVGRVGG
jgi:hypothetical protein